MHHEMDIRRVFTDNKPDRIVLSDSKSDANRFVLVVIVVAAINIVRKFQCWHQNNKITWTKQRPTTTRTFPNDVSVRTAKNVVKDLLL